MRKARKTHRGKFSGPRMAAAGKNILRATAGGFVLCGVLSSARAASSFWLNPLSGDWSEGVNWGPTPGVPDNADGGPAYDVTISAGGMDYSILLDIGVTLDSLTLNSASATIEGTDVLEVLTATLDQGVYRLDGGTLRPPGRHLGRRCRCFPDHGQRRRQRAGRGDHQR